jgi:hypothetical protein
MAGVFRKEDLRETRRMTDKGFVLSTWDRPIKVFHALVL